MTKEAAIESIIAIQDYTNQDENAVKVRHLIEDGKGDVTEENFYALAAGLDFQDAGNMLLLAGGATTIWDFVSGVGRYLVTRKDYDFEF